jgi:hypothetical protein
MATSKTKIQAEIRAKLMRRKVVRCLSVEFSDMVVEQSIKKSLPRSLPSDHQELAGSGYKAINLRRGFTQRPFDQVFWKVH